jgi:hypothetical protein
MRLRLATAAWVKVNCLHREEFVVVGYGTLAAMARRRSAVASPPAVGNIQNAARRTAAAHQPLRILGTLSL